MPPQPAHKGLLRDETLHLRWLLGLECGRLAKPPSGVECGSDCPSSKSKLKSLRLVAIDVETTNYENLSAEDGLSLGVSILDASVLRAATIARRGDGGISDQPRDGQQIVKEATSPIQSHHLAVGNPDYQKKSCREFIFGLGESINPSDVRKRLMDLISVHKYEYVLVSHGGAVTDFRFFDHLGIEPSPICRVDTLKAAQHPLQLEYRPSLEHLLQRFSIPFGALHCAGNDAHFALCALLMIAMEDCRQGLAVAAAEDLTGEEESIIEAMRLIALAPRPNVKSWSKRTGNTKEHHQIRRERNIRRKLAMEERKVAEAKKQKKVAEARKLAAREAAVEDKI